MRRAFGFVGVRSGLVGPLAAKRAFSRPRISAGALLAGSAGRPSAQPSASRRARSASSGPAPSEERAAPAGGASLRSGPAPSGERAAPAGGASLRMPLVASRRTSHIARLLPHQFVVACGVATFWRGTWYIMDATCPADPLLSGLTCLSAGFASFAVLQSVAGPLLVRAAPSGPLAPALRIATLYSLGVSTVAVWRGVWCLLDALSENVAGSTVAEHLLHSGVASHVGAVGLLLALGRMTSILAPPAKTGLLNDNKVWSAQPEEIRWLDWTCLAQLLGLQPQQRHEQPPPPPHQPSASKTAAEAELVEEGDEADAADGGPWSGSAWASRVRSARRIRRIRRMYSSDDS